MVKNAFFFVRMFVVKPRMPITIWRYKLTCSEAKNKEKSYYFFGHKNGMLSCSFTSTGVSWKASPCPFFHLRGRCLCIHNITHDFHHWFSIAYTQAILLLKVFLSKRKTPHAHSSKRCCLSTLNPVKKITPLNTCNEPISNNFKLFGQWAKHKQAHEGISKTAWGRLLGPLPPDSRQQTAELELDWQSGSALPVPGQQNQILLFVLLFFFLFLFLF